MKWQGQKAITLVLIIIALIPAVPAFTPKNHKKLWTWIIVGLLSAVVIIGFVEGKVYEYGVLAYWTAGLIEVSLFLMGILVGSEYAEWRHREIAR